MIADLCLGARYSSFKALESAIDKFSKETNSVYIVNHSRSVELENKIRPPNKQIPLCLKYKNIKYACKHYGKTRSNSRGLRPNQSSFKIGCPSYFYVAANTKELVVEKIELKHSHSCDPELVQLYPERRSLSNARCDDEAEDGSGVSLKSVREDVLDLLSIGVERRRILNYVWATSGKKLFAGDLSNIAKSIKDTLRAVSSERAEHLLEQLKEMENKQNGSTYLPKNKLGGLSAMKRKVPFSPETVVKTEIISNEDSSEQNYSVIYEGEQGEQGDNTMYVTDMVYQENTEDIQYQYENQDEATGNENATTSWSENSSLADVVKSILGPNQEGPVILHVNNYDGVAVVQVADPQTYSTSESHEIQQSPEEEEVIIPEAIPESQPVTRLVVKKSAAQKKPVVVTAVPEHSNKNSSRDNLLKSAQLKQAGSTSGQKSPSKIENTESNDDNLSDDGNEFGTQDDSSETHSDHRSVLEEERTMYRVKTKKIRLQIHNLRNCIERQALEKRKLQLEIQLLKMQVEEKESEAQQKRKVPDKKK
ncbi:uncharacterized protein LOC117641688 isoform X2 [Thrips palmi]|nr:uncharacterized protein LOC117641688 isoform X2 [Thrips palmi]XP_034235099.1 uncharacterized protein LOC117641688 isoform X2 [Thrips palmi]